MVRWAWNWTYDAETGYRRSFISFVQILRNPLIPLFTVICKPNTQPENQSADVMGFHAAILPGRLICDGEMTFWAIGSLSGHISISSVYLS